MNLSNSKTQYIPSGGLSVGTWTQPEDDRLKEAVAKHGPKWVVVATHVGTRNGDQCAKRWNENLNPELDHSPLHPAEDKLLLHLIEVYGHNWKFLANNFFEKRAPLSLKNRNSYLERRRKRQAQAHTTRRRGPQLPPTPPMSKEASPVLSIELKDLPDAPMRFDSNIPLGADESRYNSLRNSSSSHTDGDLTRPAHSTDTFTDVSNFKLKNSPGVTRNSSPNIQQESSLINNVSMQDSQMFSDLDQVDWQSFMNNVPPIGCPTDSDFFNTSDPNLEHNFLPMLHAHGENTPNLPNTGLGANTQPKGAGAIEYTLTCPRSKVNNLVQHLINAAMPMALEPRILDDREQQVVLDLRLRKCSVH